MILLSRKIFSYVCKHNELKIEARKYKADFFTGEHNYRLVVCIQVLYL
jgi:hypothetical protein